MEWLGVNQRRLGTAMLLFGLAGLLVATVVAVALFSGALAARDLDDRLRADQEQVATSLTRLSATMDSFALSTQNAGTTLQTSSDAIADAQVVMGSTATTLVALSEALDISILGSAPFAAASQQLADLGRTVSGLEQRARTLSLNLHQNSADAGVMTGQVRELKSQVNDLTSRISGIDRIGEAVALLIGGIVLAALLTAWVGIGAAFCAWAGWRLRRHGAAAQDGAGASVG